ncbi:HAD-like domain-containing protein [Mycotypha africana]|uniref:HAD-like domain-containing protein n=1 Tax=Mycotypha africana TaxID=64632 RepID=UPI002300082A|nr:HAD-like domain-containing protein [Mycotypha africana]KAI8984787.1 HAD-like domain-containing protein [Mycotypha africana]
MKFGNFLEERKRHLPSPYADYCIDYNQLKGFLKSNVLPHSIKSSSTTDVEQKRSFADIVSDRLTQLNSCLVTFIQQLEVEVSKVCHWFDVESARIIKEGHKVNENVIVLLPESEAVAHLRQIIILERFVFLNYTAITKILKKSDRHSGLALSEPYLQRVAQLSFVKANALNQFKKLIMSQIQQQHQYTEGVKDVLPPPSTRPVRSRSSQIQHASAKALPPAFIGPNQKVLVSLSGPHGTDIVGAVLSCLARHPCDIDDVMLSRLYHQVTFGVLITLQEDNVAMFRDLAEAAKKWDAILTYDIPDSQAIEPVVRHQSSDRQTADPKSASTVLEKPLSPIYTVPSSLEEAPYSQRVKYAATLFNQNGLSAAFLNNFTLLLLKHRISIEKWTRLNKPSLLSCVDLRLSVPLETIMDNLRSELIELSTREGTDIAFQKDDVYRKNKRLVVFDMDSTLIYQEVIDEIARYAGVVEQVSAITELAMNGEIDFKESLRRRVALLAGTSVQVLEEVKQILIFTEGAKYLCRALKKLGFKLAVISGGFMPLASYVKSELGLDYAFANHLEVSADGLTLTGRTIGPIVDGIRKAELLEVIAQAEGLSLRQVIAVGDGANDLWMLNKASLGIAFNAKPRVQAQARARINQKSLKYVLTLLGYSDIDMEELEKQ